MVLSQFLVEADVQLGVIVSKDGAYAAQENGDALVSAGKAMVEILEQGDVLAVFFQRLERLRHVVANSSLRYVWKEGLLVDTVVVGKTDKSLDGPVL